MERIATSLNDEMAKDAVRHEVGTLAADANPLDERMRAMAANTGFPTPQKSLETRQHAETGLKADPDNARLLGLLANVLASDVLNAWNGAGKPEVDRAEVAAKKAISLDHNTAIAHYALGFVLRLRGNHQAALDAFNEAIKIDPNLAKAHAQAANEMVFTGNARGAIPLAEKAAQLSPQDPLVTIRRRSKRLKNRYARGRTFGLPKRGWLPPMPCPIKMQRRAMRSEHLRRRHSAPNSTSIGSPNTTRKSSTKIPRYRRLRRRC